MTNETDPRVTQDRRATFECFTIKATYRRKSDRVDGVWPENVVNEDGSVGFKHEEDDAPPIRIDGPSDLAKLLSGGGGGCNCPKCQGQAQNCIGLETYVEAPSPHKALKWFHLHYPQVTDIVELWGIRAAPIKVDFRGLIPTYPTEG